MVSEMLSGTNGDLIDDRTLMESLVMCLLYPCFFHLLAGFVICFSKCFGWL